MSNIKPFAHRKKSIDTEVYLKKLDSSYATYACATPEKIITGVNKKSRKIGIRRKNIKTGEIEIWGSKTSQKIYTLNGCQPKICALSIWKNKIILNNQ